MLSRGFRVSLGRGGVAGMESAKSNTRTRIPGANCTEKAVFDFGLWVEKNIGIATCRLRPADRHSQPAP
eukprot:495173-Rhodomonas_salina.1